MKFIFINVLVSISPFSFLIFLSYLEHKVKITGANDTGGIGTKEFSIPNPPILVITHEPNSNCFKPKDLTWKNNKKEIYTIAGAKCADDGSIIENNVQRRYAVYTILSGDKLYCSDN